MRLNGKTVLITGASSGLGAEMARQLAQKDCRLLLLARREGKLKELVDLISGEQKQHLYFACDVADFTSVKKCCSNLLEENIIPDVLFLNAGISTGFSVHEFSIKKIKDLFEVNFWGSLNFLEFFLPKMLERKHGQIVFVGSLAGLRGMPKSAPYSASKAALEKFMESLRIDLLHTNIICTHILPGFVKSELTAKNKYYMPFLMETRDAVKRMISGIEKNKSEIHFPKRLSIPAKLSRFLPNIIYARLMSNKR